MDNGNWIISVIVFGGLVTLTAILYGFSAGIQNINKTELEQKVNQGSWRAKKLLQILQKPSLWSSALVSSLVAFLTGLYYCYYLRDLVRVLFVATGIKPTLFYTVSVTVLGGGFMLAVLLILGVVLPVWHASQRPCKWSYAILPIALILDFLMVPLSYGSIRISGFLRIKKSGRQADVLEDGIRTWISESQKQGVLEDSEAKMIHNIVNLDTKSVADIMIHRKHIIAISADLTLAQAVDFILTDGSKSRYPVYKETIDDIIGILHIKDAVIFARHQKDKALTLDQVPGVLRKAFFIPETRYIHHLFQEMQAQKIQMQMIIDEYGQTVGIITLEDILEEIVGSISDEYDQEENYIMELPDGSFLIQGKTPLEEIERMLKLQLSHEEYDTLNGFLISQIGRIPESDDQAEVICGSYLFQITEVKNKMINRVRVILRPLEEEPPEV